MRAWIDVSVAPEDRRRLEAIGRDRNAAQTHVARAKVILATAALPFRSGSSYCHWQA
jgi:hypothetical protein